MCGVCPVNAILYMYMYMMKRLLENCEILADTGIEPGASDLSHQCSTT